MIKTLQKHGNSQALVIEKPLMDALGIDRDTQLAVTITGSSLVVTPVHVGVGTEGVEASIAKLRPRYRKMLEELAK